MAWGIVGGGFGLYGYLPALVEESGETIATLEKYRPFILSRSDLLPFIGLLRFVSDLGELIRCCDHLVIARRPVDQMSLVETLTSGGWQGALLLEKPLARSPKEAGLLLERLRAAGINFSVGYTLVETEWAVTAQGIFAHAKPDQIEISWRFLAHHYRHRLNNWKRFASEGGGALRFYCSHIVAFLAAVRSWTPEECTPALLGDEDPLVRFSLRSAGCSAVVECDSSWTGIPCFQISMKEGERTLFKFENRDPFVAAADPLQDARIVYLRNIARRLAAGHFLSTGESAKQLALWNGIEQVRSR